MQNKKTPIKNALRQNEKKKRFSFCDISETTKNGKIQ
jgi:hypothetical protein